MGERGSVLVRLAVWAYDIGLRLMPRAFRAEYGDESRACFQRIATEARARRGRRAVLSVAVRSLVDVLASAPKRHRSASRADVLARGSWWTGTWTDDVRQAARKLRRRPSFTFTTVLTLGLGIAATTSVFSLVYGVLLNPLPYPDAARIVEVDHAGPGVGADRDLGITFGFYREYAARVRSAEAMAMYSYVEETLTGRGDPVRLRGARATPSLEAVLGVRPLFGRWFTAEEAEPGGAPAVVLSHGLWRERFGGDVSVVGTSIELGGIRREVFGVMPASFTFPSADRLFWVPNDVPATQVGGWSERAVARLAAGVDAETLRRELVSLLPVMRETTDDPRTMALFLDDARVTPLIVPLKESIVGEVRRTLWILFGTVGLVLLIAVANVANLFLVRAEEAQRETAVRRALGAGRGRIVRGFMIETLLISLAAGVVGVLAAASAIRVLRLRAPVNVPRLDEVGLHPTVLLVALLTVLAAAALLGLLPALRRQAGPAGALAEGGRRSTAGRARRRGREVLMATQIALALVLLIGSGLLFRTFHQLRAVDVGFTEREALTFELGLPFARYETGAEAQAFQLRALERVRALPGVRSAGAVGRCLPLVDSMCGGETLEVEGRPAVQGQVPPVTGGRVASEDYFQSIGISVRGRSFAAADAVGEASVVVLSRATAEAYFPGEDALGKRVRFRNGPWHTVVGIANDVRGKVETSAPDELRRLIYLPMLPEGVDGPGTQQLSYVVRTTAVPPLSVVPAVRAALAELDPGLPLANVRTLQQVIDAATAPTAFALTLIGLAAAIALLLGAVGVYAVIAYSVSCRTAEIGVRMALGARASDVRAMVLRQGAAVVAIGVGIGLVAAFGLTRLMAGMLYGVSATDPFSYATLTIFMAAIAALALWLPARRASRVDPMEALRLE